MFKILIRVLLFNFQFSVADLLIGIFFGLIFKSVWVFIIVEIISATFGMTFMLLQRKIGKTKIENF